MSRADSDYKQWDVYHRTRDKLDRLCDHDRRRIRTDEIQVIFDEAIATAKSSGIPAKCFSKPVDMTEPKRRIMIKKDTFKQIREFSAWCRSANFSDIMDIVADMALLKRKMPIVEKTPETQEGGDDA